MPLKRGSNKQTIAANIRELMHAGHPQKQAVAIAMREAHMTTSNKKYTNSPDSYDDTSLGAQPPKQHYQSAPENYTTAESPKRAGGTPSGVQQGTGTDSPRANSRTRDSGLPDVPKGKTSWGGISSYDDSGDLP